MAITPILITGFEYGLAAPVTDGGGLWDIISGSPSVQSSVKRTGDYALWCGCTTEGQYLKKDLAGTSEYLVGRFYIRKSATPGSGVNILTGYKGGGEYLKIILESDGKINAQVAIGTSVSGPTINVDTWYCVEFKFYVHTTTGTIDWKVDGAAQTQATGAITTGGFFYELWLGQGSTAGINIYYDDIIVSAIPGDYPIGEGSVIGLRPNEDGTHVSGANEMEFTDGTDITPATTTAYTMLDESPWTANYNTDCIQQATANNNAYCEINFADATNNNISGVSAILQYSSGSNATCRGAAYIVDSNATVSTIWGNTSSHETYIANQVPMYKSVMVTPPAGGWTVAEVNALKARIGHSNDVTPNPYWLGLILEVAGNGTISGFNANNYVQLRWTR